MEKESKLKLYAIGYIAKDIEEDSMFVDIFPAESINTHEGELNDQSIVNTTTKDIEGNVLTIAVDKSRLITAKWLPLNQSNRVTPPNVCKGETVIIYNYAGTDDYYWNTMYAEPDLRKREKATYYFSNKGSIEDGWEDKAYTFTIDTINKYIKLHTADNDGELTTYDLTINTEEGIITLIDGKDNSVELNSDSDILTINTNMGLNINTMNIVTTSATSTHVTGAYTLKSGICNINP